MALRGYLSMLCAKDDVKRMKPFNKAAADDDDDDDDADRRSLFITMRDVYRTQNTAELI